MVSSAANKSSNAPEFPLEAYVVNPDCSYKKKRTLQQGGQLTSMDTQPRILPQWIYRNFAVFICAWMTYMISYEATKYTCYASLPSSLAPPPALCDRIPPSLGQFWALVFSKEEPSIHSPAVSLQVATLRQLLALPKRRDYALRGIGAAILHEFTAAAYTPSSRTNGRLDADVYPASVVLEEQNVIGECWEFEGSSGRLGIRLSEPIDLTGFTITYPDTLLLPSSFLTKAPRSVTFWALINSESAPHRFQNARQPIDFAVSKNRLPQHFPFNHSFLPVARAIYDTHQGHSRQFFPFNNSMPGLHRILTQHVLVDVNSNWGSSTTCLHHIAVHGHPISTD